MSTDENPGAKIKPENDPLNVARDVLDKEINGLAALRDSLGDTFEKAAELLSAPRAAQSISNPTSSTQPISPHGRIIVTGMGKSGHIARKIAATFASTGAPSLFVHPAEASHGDLGMIAPQDVVLALSKSGETHELHNIVSHAKRFSIPLVAITGGAGSTLAKAAAVTILLPNAVEACDQTRAPTTSTTMMLAVGDALAVALLRQKGFTSAAFRDFHPGGNLGAALRRVKDLMHTDLSSLPLCPEHTSLSDAVHKMTAGGFGCIGVTNSADHLIGMLTDGDLRRRFGEATPDQPLAVIMTRAPKTVTPDTLAGEALRLMSDGKITALFVVENGAPVGLLHIHDCLAVGVL